MRGDNYLLAITTTTDEVTGDVKPLFALPIQICKGTEESKVKFDWAAPSGAPRAQVFVDSVTGEPVGPEDCTRGVRVTEDDFREIDAEEIAKIDAEEKITTIVAEGTEPLAGLREEYGDRITGRYFVQSPVKGGSAKAYRMVYESLREVRKGKKVLAPARAIIVRRTKRTKQALAFIYADETQGALVLCEMVFANQVREADEAVKQPVATAQIEQTQIDKLRIVLDALGPGRPTLDTAIDEAEARKVALIEAALNGDVIEPMPMPVAATVEMDNLAAALDASLAAAGV